MPKPRILIGDDHILIVEALRAVLEEHFEVVGVATNGRDLALEAQRLVPDLVLVDMAMPIMNGIEAAQVIKQSVPTAHVVFLTQTTDRACIQAALAAGGSGYLVKQSVASELVSGIWKVLNGEVYVSPSLRTRVPGALGAGSDAVEDLTRTQCEILLLMVAGKANQEIANVLQISMKTVEFHQARMRDRYGVHSTAELLQYAVEHGLCAAQQ